MIFLIILLPVCSYSSGAVWPSNHVQVIYSLFGSIVIKDHTWFLLLSSADCSTFVQRAHEDNISPSISAMCRNCHRLCCERMNLPPWLFSGALKVSSGNLAGLCITCCPDFLSLCWQELLPCWLSLAQSLLCFLHTASLAFTWRWR